MLTHRTGKHLRAAGRRPRALRLGAPEDAILIAALARGLVETASREWKAGRKPVDMPTSLLRLATWRASRSGLDGELVDPRSGRPVPAQRVLVDLRTVVLDAVHDGSGRSGQPGSVLVTRDESGYLRATMVDG